MNETDLLTLLLIDSGDYHALRCTRADNGLSVAHFEDSERKLLEHDFIEFVGDELTTSVLGKLAIEHAITATW
jgi:hypothetical protein